jgi:hypothetical protein
VSTLADIYVSRDDQAATYDTAPEQFADRAQYKGITPFELSILWSIFRGVEWDVAMMQEFPCQHEIDGGERFIHRLPAAMVSELARDQIASASSAWAATEELSCSAEDIAPVAADLVRLARRASETSQSVYVWNCV